MLQQKRIHTLKDEAYLNRPDDEPTELSLYYRRGLITAKEWDRLIDQMDCTCQPALPDGRESVCGFCESHKPIVEEIKF